MMNNKSEIGIKQEREIQNHTKSINVTIAVETVLAFIILTGGDCYSKPEKRFYLIEKL